VLSGPSEPSDPEVTDHLQEIYDEETLAALDSWSSGRRAAPVDAEPSPVPGAVPRRGPRGLGMALLAGTTLGLRETFEDEGDHEALVELDPDVDIGEQWITFIHVPGDPRASRILIRPWLAPSRVI
jgi:hypothetical protein